MNNVTWFLNMSVLAHSISIHSCTHLCPGFRPGDFSLLNGMFCPDCWLEKQLSVTLKLSIFDTVFFTVCA